MASVIPPAVDAMRRRGTPYRGLLYAGLCLTPAGLRVVEFNARFGDPETQVVLDRLGTPLAPLLHAAAAGDLAGTLPAGTAAVAARRRGGRGDRRRGLPGKPGQGREDQILRGRTNRNDTPGRPRYQPAFLRTARGHRHRRRGDLVSAGGRVLNVVGSGPDIAAARAPPTSWRPRFPCVAAGTATTSPRRARGRDPDPRGVPRGASGVGQSPRSRGVWDRPPRQ